jgi:hypothetical protein
MAKELDKLISDAFEESLPDCLGESFERRRGQLEMALAVGASAAQKRIAVIEADTDLLFSRRETSRYLDLYQDAAASVDREGFLAGFESYTHHC